MPSSSTATSFKFKQYLAKENNCRIAFFVIFCSIIGTPLFFHGLKELYKIKTLVMGQCQVKSIDLKTEENNVYPLWFITILYNNQKTEDIIIGSTGYWLRNTAWYAAHDYRINETYPCYRWKNLTLTPAFSWQWNKPPESNIGAYLFSGITLLVISILIPILKRHYQIEFGRNQQQQQIEIPLRNRQSSLPTYDQAIQSLPPMTTQ